MNTTAEDVRPAVKSMLPFKVLGPSARGATELEYEEVVAVPSGGNRRLTFRMSGDERPGVQVLELMRQYRDLEGRVDLLVKERDDLQARVVEAEAAARRLQGQVDEALRRDRESRPEGKVRR